MALISKENIKMHILISNDDGYLAPGIQGELARAMKKFGKVTIVAPERNQKPGASNSLTLHLPLRIQQLQENLYFVTGTPE